MRLVGCVLAATRSGAARNDARRGKAPLLVLALVCLALAPILCLVPALASESATATASEKVRVGYLFYSGYQEGGEGEPKSGSGYEYLQKIASYTGWEYEYVYGSFGELLAMLEAGEIDIMGNISKTADRIDKLDYGRYAAGSEVFTLSIQGEGSSIDKGDLSTLSGKRVGVSQGTNQDSVLEAWLEANFIEDVELVYYTDAQTRFDDFNNGVVDAVVVAYGGQQSSWTTLTQIGEDSYYFATNKSKPQLKEQLDLAQEQILLNDPDYNDTVLASAINYGTDNAELSDEETSWLSEHPTLRVGYLSAASPYSYVNRDGSFSGFLQRMVEGLASFCETDVSFVSYDTYTDLIEAVQAGEVDLIAPISSDSWFAEDNGIAISTELTSFSVVAVTSTPRDDVQELSSIAVNEVDSLQLAYAEQHYPDAELILCEDMRAALEAVRDGEAEATFVTYDMFTEYARQDSSLLALHTLETGSSTGISMAFRRGDTVPLSIVNKYIATLSSSEVSSALATSIREAEDVQTASRFLEQNRVAIAAALIAIVAVVALVAFLYRRELHRRQELEMALAAYDEADHDRRTDFLTGLLNRQDLFLTLRQALDGTMEPIEAMFMLDIDDYKRFNDHYGHEEGDVCLSRIGAALKAYGEENGLRVYRYGGEEMLAVGFAMAKPAEQIAQELVELVRGLGIERDDAPCGRVTVSVGYTTNNSRYEKMVDYADSAMYQAKRSGKNRAASYERDCVGKAAPAEGDGQAADGTEGAPSQKVDKHLP